MENAEPAPRRSRAGVHAGIAVAVAAMLLVGAMFMARGQAEQAYLREHGVELPGLVVRAERIDKLSERFSTGADREERFRYKHYLTYVFDHPEAGLVEHRRIVHHPLYARYREAQPDRPIRVSVRVDPHDPERFLLTDRLGSDSPNYAVPVFLTAAGLAFFYALGAGGVLLLSRRKVYADGNR